MNKIKRNIILVSILIFSSTLALAEWKISNSKKTTLIELYTSEGCSSYPPADAFLSQLKTSGELWNNYIPMAFHVDYWDYIGWKDRFAESEFTNRQTLHQLQGNSKSVYTPEFIVNGKEWKGYFGFNRIIPNGKSNQGKISLKIKDTNIQIDFNNDKEEQMQKMYNLVILGMGLSTKIRAGENSGKQLNHDFVVLKHHSKLGDGSVNFALPEITTHKPKKLAIAAWVSSPDSLKPIQSVGAKIPEDISIKILK